MSFIEENIPIPDFETRASSTLGEMERAGFKERLWRKDPTLWAAPSKDTPRQKEQIRNSLGWLIVGESMKEKADELKKFSESVKNLGFNRIVLIGMGGSGLAPMVFSRVFGPSPGFPHLFVIDTTDPVTIKNVEDSIDPLKTLFIVSSKSGTTIEVLSLFEYFYDKVSKEIGNSAGKNFVSITDEGSPLDMLSKKTGFLATFLNPKDIGGRYSALSYFGLLPAALIGVDVSRLLHSASIMRKMCGPDSRLTENPGIRLGVVLSTLCFQGRDKLTFFMPQKLIPFGLWLEQLLAESIGKEGKGIVPIIDEPMGDVDGYGKDRVFIYIGYERDGIKKILDGFGKKSHPVITIGLRDNYDMGGEFFRWQIATATIGWVLGVNPFDQPDVEDAKKKTRAILREIEEKRELPHPKRVFEDDNLSLYFGTSTMERLKGKTRIKDFFGLLKEGSYIALLCYADTEDKSIHKELSFIRRSLRDRFGCPVSFGYGPRYLHSTGQLYKGGVDKGIFIIVASENRDIAIPKRSYSFGQLESSQALADALEIDGRKRPVMFLDLKKRGVASFKKLGLFFENGLKST